MPLWWRYSYTLTLFYGYRHVCRRRLLIGLCSISTKFSGVPYRWDYIVGDLSRPQMSITIDRKCLYSINGTISDVKFPWLWLDCTTWKTILKKSGYIRRETHSHYLVLLNWNNTFLIRNFKVEVGNATGRIAGKLAAEHPLEKAILINTYLKKCFCFVDWLLTSSALTNRKN